MPGGAEMAFGGFTKVAADDGAIMLGAAAAAAAAATTGGRVGAPTGHWDQDMSSVTARRESLTRVV